ncbi:AidA/PixA family protein [Xenorhabdus bovienii]|uniref:AidA/PixA family protein n=1 Tax=Xenorhabdus bovienii TaxID=40576 RepID=UPI003DA3D1DD
MAIYNVLIALDVDQMIKKYEQQTATKERPLRIQDNYIHLLLVNKDGQVIDQGGSKLSLNGIAVGDKIMWRTVSLSKYNTPNSVMQLDYKSNNKASLIETPVLNKMICLRPIVVNTDPVEIGSQEIPGYYWSAEVLEAGGLYEQIYNATFVIYDNKAKPYKYFLWNHIVSLGDIKDIYKVFIYRL